MKVPVGGNEAQVRLSVISYLTQKKRSRIENVVFFYYLHITKLWIKL